MKNKIHILIIGYSNIAKKRYINYFKKKNFLYSIASKSHRQKIHGVLHQYANYEMALKKSNAKIVYISLPNSLHYFWAKKALNYGYHVIVDKPLCDTYLKSLELINLAKNKKKLISEAIFYNYHRQIKESLKILGGKKNILRLDANFTIPKPPKSSILLSKKLNGGVIMDMGPYAASIHRIFFNLKIINKKFSINLNKKKLPLEMNLKIFYHNKNYNGKFQFCGKYKNQIILFSKNYKIIMNRVFSPPDDLDLHIDVTKKKSKYRIVLKKDNCFANYFMRILNSIYKKKYSVFYNQILKDHHFRNHII